MPAAVLPVAWKADECLLFGDLKLLYTGGRNLFNISALSSLLTVSFPFPFISAAATASDQLDALHHHHEREAQVCRSRVHHHSSHDTGVPLRVDHGLHSLWEHD
jgi:hypothetical protein